VSPFAVHGAASTTASTLQPGDDGSNYSEAEAYLVSPLATATYVKTGTEHGELLGSAAGGGGGGGGRGASRLAPGEEEVRGCGDVGMFKDVWASALFVFNIGVLVALCIDEIVHSLHDISSNNNNNNNNNSGNSKQEQQDASDSANGLGSLVWAFVLMSIFALTAGASLYLTLLVRYSEIIISAMLVMTIVVFALLGGFFLLEGQTIASILFFLFACGSYYYYKTCQARIVFASAILKAASNAVKAHLTGLLSTSMAMLSLLLVYILVWFVAFYGVISTFLEQNEQAAKAKQAAGGGANQTMDDDGEGNVSALQTFVFFLFLLSLYWGQQVFKNVVSSVVSGTMACWWFMPNREQPVRGSIFRSLTTSFGSICMGSLLVAFMHTLRDFLNMLRNSTQRRVGDDRGNNRGLAVLVSVCLLWLLEALVGCIERGLEYFNKYAFVYNAAYGTNFLTSGTRVMSLFKRRGWTLLINDDLIGNALFLGILALAGSTACFSAFFSFLFYNHLVAAGFANPITSLVIIGGFLGFAVGAMISNVVSSAVAAVFVFFAEDPSALALNHAETYNELMSKWRALHPTSLIWLDQDLEQQPGGYLVAQPVSVREASAPPVTEFRY